MQRALPPHYTFRPVVRDHHTAARAYFLCVLGLLFVESAIRLPGWIQMVLRKRDPAPRRAPHHWPPTVWLHKVLTRPSPVPMLTSHPISSMLRLLVFISLNVLFGWNRIRFTTDFQRFGWLTIANAGLALLLPTRHNLLALALRIPAPVLLGYHRWAGVAAVVHATLHFALTAQRYIHGEQFDVVLENARIRVGILAWLALALMALTSLRLVRRRGFELFYYTHFLFLVFVGGALYHASHGPEFLVPGLVLWGLDRAWRLWENVGRAVVVREVSHYAGEVVKVRFEGVKTREPAQVAWVQVEGVSAVNWHPFTIASAPGDDVGTIAVRALGGFTRRVQKVGHRKGAMDMAAKDGHGCESDDSLRVRMDGPYGLGSSRWTRSPVVAIVAGGIGITPGISIMSHIVKEALHMERGCSGAQRHVYLLWTVSDISHARWFEDELKALAEVASRPDVPVSFTVTIHVTNRDAGRKSGMGPEEQRMDGEGGLYSGPGEIHQGRPDVLQWFQYVKESTTASDVAVSVCGPQSLKNDARKAAAGVSCRGGLFLVEEEVFEL